MSFNYNKPVYLQIVDSILMRILNHELKSNDKMLSIREYGMKIGVNPNTIMRSYEYLTNKGIIYNKRGIGYFVSVDAFDIVFTIQKKYFIEKEIPIIKQKMKFLNLDYSIFKE